VAKSSSGRARLPGPLVFIAAIALGSTNAVAVDFQFSGFGSVAAGKTSGECTPENALPDQFRNNCTRFIADWARGGVYSDSAALRPESRIGLQGTTTFNAKWSATAQVVLRGIRDEEAAMEWAFVTYKPSPSWTIQAGRKRLPLFYYSDFQDVGYAFAWARVPADVYGWDIVNFNGGSVAYNGQAPGGSIRASTFTGFETSKKNGYSRLLYNEAKDTKWTRIVGADLEWSNNWLTGRVVYVRSGFQQIDHGSGQAEELAHGRDRGNHRAYGGSLNADLGKWQLRSEYSVFDRNEYQLFKSDAWFVSAGYRIGAFTPYVLTSRYTESTRDADRYTPTGFSTAAVGVRYDVSKSGALKLQFDRFRGFDAIFQGDSGLVSLSYNFVF
jgi:hypothetical protein